MVKPAEMRKRKLERKLKPSIYARRFAAQREDIIEQAGQRWTEQAQVEMKVKNICEAVGVSTSFLKDYICFGREVLAIQRKYHAISMGDEAIAAIDVWTTRGLQRSLLNKLAYNMYAMPVWKTPNPNLVLSLNLDRGVGLEALDDSGLANHGAINGATWVGRPENSVFGKALSFNGIDNYIEIGDSPSLNFGSEDFAVEAWIKTAHGKGIINKWGHITDIGWFMGIDSLGRMVAYLSDGVNWVQPKTTETVKDDIWHHLLFTRSNLLKLYIDGDLVKQVDASMVGSVSAPTFALLIGVLDSEEMGDWWKGTLDEIRIHNKVLTDEEIQRKYQIGARHL